MSPGSFTNRPRFAFVTAIVTTLLGLLSLFIIPVDQFPDITSPDILVAVNLLSLDDRFDGVFLSNYASPNVAPELARLDGVGEAAIIGALDYGMRIWLDPLKLAQKNLSVDDVLRSLREQNAQAAASLHHTEQVMDKGVESRKAEPAFENVLSVNGHSLLNTAFQSNAGIPSTAAGFSSGEAMGAMEAVAAGHLPQGTNTSGRGRVLKNGNLGTWRRPRSPCVERSELAWYRESRSASTGRSAWSSSSDSPPRRRSWSSRSRSRSGSARGSRSWTPRSGRPVSGCARW